MTHDVRDEVVDYVAKWSGRTELSATRLVKWIGVGMSKFYDWRARYGKVNEHNRLVPRDHWLEAWEREPKTVPDTFVLRFCGMTGVRTL